MTKTNQTMYYKIIHGYNSEEYIEIEENELEKAFYVFLTKKDAVFSGGAVKGGQILFIKPDFHRTMGWHRGYKLDDWDYAELSDRKIDRKMQGVLENTKEKVQYLISTRQENLIGTGFELPKLNPTSETKQLSDKMKV